MGTRGLLHVLNEDKKILVTVYVQYDGYPNGFGKNIIKILNDGKSKIVNGFSNHKIPETFNGMGCLAAYLIGELKNKTIGGTYIERPNSQNIGEEYVYKIWPENLILQIKITGKYSKKQIYKGLLSELNVEKLNVK